MKSCGDIDKVTYKFQRFFNVCYLCKPIFELLIFFHIVESEQCEMIVIAFVNLFLIVITDSQSF